MLGEHLAAAAVEPLVESLFVHSVALAVMASALLILVGAGVCGRAGFTLTEAVVILVAVIAGVLLPPEIVEFGLLEVGGLSLRGNVLGAGVPLLLSLKVVMRSGLSPGRVVGGLVLMSFVAFEVSSFDPESGIVIQHFAIVPIVAALLAVIFRGLTDRRSPPLAYFYGTVGLLLGADLLRLPQLLRETGEVSATIGGAGISDALFLSGIVAVAMDAAVAYLADGPGAEPPSSDAAAG